MLPRRVIPGTIVAPVSRFRREVPGTGGLVAVIGDACCIKTRTRLVLFHPLYARSIIRTLPATKFCREYEPYTKEHFSKLAFAIHSRCRHYGHGNGPMSCYLIRELLDECPFMYEKRCSDTTVADWETVLNNMPLRRYISFLETFLSSPYAGGVK